MTVRPLIEGDLDAVVQLASAQQDILQHYEPRFWRRHADADENRRAWFAFLAQDPAHLVVVSDADGGAIDGFLIARAADAPPAYDPGGKTCLIDDFVWVAPAVARSLLSSATEWAHEQGCSQVVVVTARADQDRRTFLDRAGLHPVSEWWVGDLTTATDAEA